MDITTTVALVVGVILGAVGGYAVAALITRAHHQTDTARTDADGARQEAYLAQVRTEAAQARSETAQVRAEAALARSDVAEAKAMAAAAQAEAAEVSAAVARAEAERDAAVEHAKVLAADREQMLAHFKVMSTETIERQTRTVDAQAEARLKATEQLLSPVRDSLHRFQDRLTEVEKERVAIAADLRHQVQSVQLTGEQLRRETSALTTALRKPQVRGAWGELQLQRVVELAGMVEHCDFVRQHTDTANDRVIRPDLKVNLAEGKFVYVDAKVPLTAFLDAQETEDARTREESMSRFAQNVRTHVDQLGGKRYWQASAGTPEFVVLFMPSEALAAEAYAILPDLHEYAARRDVVLATPTTLIALLRAVAYGWKQARLAENAAEVLQLGRDLHERLGTLGSRFDKLGRALRTSVTAYNETIATVEGRVLVKARQFTELKVSDAELKALTGVDDPVRQIQAPELVDDAVRIEPLIGRTRRSRRRGELPEGAELRRSDPELFELVDEAGPPTPDDGEDRVSS
ncbi:MAG: DNA recombination protein RmuC [Microlunatus sp.]|nr:DNA recombination protein RmuC [Microlunatus sp.]